MITSPFPSILKEGGGGEPGEGQVERRKKIRKNKRKELCICKKE